MTKEKVFKEIAEAFIASYLYDKLEHVNWYDYGLPEDYIERLRADIEEVLHKIYIASSITFSFKAEVRVDHREKDALHWEILIYDQNDELIFQIEDYKFYYQSIDEEFAVEFEDELYFGIEAIGG
ncbi:MAG: hypothetical protein KatS3mg083_267 [Candidatus Dojkabacteria bacterium]|nr:MAG: hypothetical protein KatS3mg083_267 [Candidatus Dojkabacteria bacterium]